MERPYVDWVRIEKFRCIQQVDLHLTPLHALIGPNDSGKSTILQALQNRSARYWCTGQGVALAGTVVHLAPYPAFHQANVRGLPNTHVPKPDIRTFSIARTLRLDPDVLRMPNGLIPRDQPVWFQNERGLGLAAVYDALLSRNRDAFIAIDQRFRALFTTVKALRLDNADTNTKTIGITLHNGNDVAADAMSEGMLYWLAFAVLEYVAPGGVLLVEEPENGLHPARIKEVMAVLREVAKTTQILIATHSPLVVNELNPDEVTIITRTNEAGVKAKRMVATKNFAERSKTYALGELWLSYADGDLEKDLVGDDSTAAKAG